MKEILLEELIICKWIHFNLKNHAINLLFSLLWIEILHLLRISFWQLKLSEVNRNTRVTVSFDRQQIKRRYSFLLDAECVSLPPKIKQKTKNTQDASNKKRSRLQTITRMFIWIPIFFLLLSMHVIS